MKNKIIILATLFLIINNIYSQELKRRATLGIFGSMFKDTIQNISGVKIDSLRYKDFSKKHHLKKGDIIIRMNAQEVSSMRQLAVNVNNHKEGEKVSFEIIRKNKRKELSGIYPAFPKEKSDTHEVIYDEFAFDGGYLRTIIDKPEGNKKLPAILFIQGYTCGSIDNIPMHPYIQLAKGLCDKGYVVMRMEKPGIGDCSNKTKCEDLDLNNEIEAYLQALKKLKTYDFVDTNNIFIWGHSLGGMIAPVIASHENLRGIIAYGTTIKPWREYLVEINRKQPPLFGADYVENEKYALDYYKLIYALYVDKKSPAEISQDSVMKQMLVNFFMYDGNGHIYGRNYKAFVQIDDYNQIEYWSKVNSNVLIFWADADIEAMSKYDHETIVDVVNKYNPGHATFQLIENTTHSFAKVESMAHGIKNRDWKYITTHFNKDIVEKTDQWIKNILNIQ